ncbi:MAG: efflux RND transporter periplasmic adaptor subunit [Nitrospirales bacterium]|jgi:RND family efflux transporter MFP subunit|nr:MAG: efflux RND transporter periplasmic adaptor subunit [Nitrospirales bacterium]
MMIRTNICWFLLALVVGAAGFLGCSEEQQAAQPPKGRPPTPVRVAEVVNRTVQKTIELVGTVEPWRRSVVAGELAALVEKFPVDEGMAVKRGDMLAQLRTDTLTIQLNAAEATHRESEARYQQAKKDLARIKTLFSKELITQKEYDDAVTQEAALALRLAQLESALLQVRDRLKKARVVAPFDGWVTKEFTEVGQWIEAGGPIVELVDLSRVQVEVPLPERYVGEINVGASATATFDGIPGFKAKGKVFSVVAQADRNSRTFPIKVELPNVDLRIKSGLVSRVILQVGAPYEALVIPKDALVLRGGAEFVFVLKDGSVSQVPVVPVNHVNDEVEVSGSLESGMVVVVEGNERLFSGQPVRVLEEESPT